MRRYSHISDSEVLTDAKLFKTRMSWALARPHHYYEVHYARRHLLDQCVRHMEGPYSVNHYSLYVYEFEDHSAYVGITRVWTRRHYDHQHLSGPILGKIKQNISFRLKTISNNLWYKNAASQEQRLIAQYKEDGWTVLNRTRGGELGSIRSKWTLNEMLETAKTYSSWNSFLCARRTMVNAIDRLGWREKICKETGWTIRKMIKDRSFEECLTSAKRFSSVLPWQKSDRNSYYTAWSRGWTKSIKDQLGWKRVIANKFGRRQSN